MLGNFFKSKKKINTLIYISPYLQNQYGHDNEYRKNVLQCFDEDGYKTYTITNKDSKIQSANLFYFFETLNSNLKITNFIKSLKIICKVYFFSLKKSKASQINFFMESFAVYHFVLIYIVSIFLFRRVNIYLVLRNENLFNGYYRLIKHLIKMSVLFKTYIKSLSDSNLVANYAYSDLFKTIKLIPIPHTFYRKTTQLKNKKITFSWPGNPRVNKGLSIITNLINQNKSKNKIKKFSFIIQESVKLIDNSIFELKRISGNQSRKDYVNNILNSDVILLPYDSQIYRFATSGVFVESIVLGKITLVSDQTWMSSELYKFNLPELVITSWNNSVINYAQCLLNNKEIQEKLTIMQSSYRRYHNFERFKVDLLSTVN